MPPRQRELRSAAKKVAAATPPSTVQAAGRATSKSKSNSATPTPLPKLPQITQTKKLKDVLESKALKLSPFDVKWEEKPVDSKWTDHLNFPILGDKYVRKRFMATRNNKEAEIAWVLHGLQPPADSPMAVNWDPRGTSVVDSRTFTAAERRRYRYIFDAAPIILDNLVSSAKAITEEKTAPVQPNAGNKITAKEKAAAKRPNSSSYKSFGKDKLVDWLNKHFHITNFVVLIWATTNQLPDWAMGTEVEDAEQPADDDDFGGAVGDELLEKWLSIQRRKINWNQLAVADVKKAITAWLKLLEAAKSPSDLPVVAGHRSVQEPAQQPIQVPLQQPVQQLVQQTVPQAVQRSVQHLTQESAEEAVEDPTTVSDDGDDEDLVDGEDDIIPKKIITTYVQRPIAIDTVNPFALEWPTTPTNHIKQCCIPRMSAEEVAAFVDRQTKYGEKDLWFWINALQAPDTGSYKTYSRLPEFDETDTAMQDPEYWTLVTLCKEIILEFASVEPLSPSVVARLRKGEDVGVQELIDIWALPGLDGAKQHAKHMYLPVQHRLGQIQKLVSEYTNLSIVWTECWILPKNEPLEAFADVAKEIENLVLRYDEMQTIAKVCMAREPHTVPHRFKHQFAKTIAKTGFVTSKLKARMIPKDLGIMYVQERDIILEYLQLVEDFGLPWPHVLAGNLKADDTLAESAGQFRMISREWGRICDQARKEAESGTEDSRAAGTNDSQTQPSADMPKSTPPPETNIPGRMTSYIGGLLSLVRTQGRTPTTSHGKRQADEGPIDPRALKHQKTAAIDNRPSRLGAVVPAPPVPADATYNPMVLGLARAEALFPSDQPLLHPPMFNYGIPLTTEIEQRWVQLFEEYDSQSDAELGLITKHWSDAMFAEQDLAKAENRFPRLLLLSDVGYWRDNLVGFRALHAPVLTALQAAQLQESERVEAATVEQDLAKKGRRRQRYLRRMRRLEARDEIGLLTFEQRRIWLRLDAAVQAMEYV